MENKSTSDDKCKNLEFIQGVINRLSSNAFLFKGWFITIIGAVATAMLTTENYNLLWLIFGTVLLFWFIDAYYLMLERCYCKLFSQVAKTDAEKITYDMNVQPFISFTAWYSAFRRPVMLMFYGVVLLVLAGFMVGNYFDISVTIKLKE